MPRLFTGLEIPERVAALLSGLRGGIAGARWIDVENYHVTLRFIGDVDDRTASEVAAALDRVRRPPFAMRIAGLGTFGGRKVHSLWAAIAPNPVLIALQADHERLMQRAGLPAEPRRFTPHVTLARLRGVPERTLALYLESRGGFFSEDIPVDRFVLFSSRAREGGGPYVVEETYPLRT